MDKEDKMAEMRVGEPANDNAILWMIVNNVSHEVSIENQQTSEVQISENNPTQNLTLTQCSETGDEVDITKKKKQTLITKTTPLSNIEEDKKKIHKFERPLPGSSFQNRTPFEDAAPMKLKNTDSTTENSLLVRNKQLVKLLNTSSQTCSRTIPAVLMRSVQKLFPNVHYKKSGLQTRKAANLYTPIINNNQQHNMPVSLSHISLINNSAAVCSSSTQSSIPTVHTTGISMGNGSETTMNDSSNKSDENDDESCDNFLNNTMFSTVSNLYRKVGLVNNGSTCYINSVMQALLSTHSFSTFTVMKMHIFPYWSAVAELFGNMMYTICSSVNPKRCYLEFSSPYFNIFEEHDAAEFLLYLLQTLKNHEPIWEVGRRRSASNAQPSTSTDVRDNAVAGCSNQTAEELHAKRPKIDGYDNTRKYYIDHTFGIFLSTAIKCQVCQSISKKLEMVYSLHLSFPEVMLEETQSIQSLLDYYFTTETLTGDNRYMCDTCCYHQDALKNSIVIQTPKCLILTLKNFSYDMKKKELKKNVRKVICNDTINLHSRLSRKDRTNYRLYAMIIHRGRSLNTGHYTALIKCNDYWFDCSDKTIRVLKEREISNSHRYETPYMLFYERIDVTEHDFPSFHEIPWLLPYIKQRREQSRNFALIV